MGVGKLQHWMQSVCIYWRSKDGSKVPIDHADRENERRRRTFPELWQFSQLGETLHIFPKTTSVCRFANSSRVRGTREKGSTHCSYVVIDNCLSDHMLSQCQVYNMQFHVLTSILAVTSTMMEFLFLCSYEHYSICRKISWSWRMQLHGCCWRDGRSMRQRNVLLYVDAYVLEYMKKLPESTNLFI